MKYNAHIHVENGIFYFLLTDNITSRAQFRNFGWDYFDDGILVRSHNKYIIINPLNLMCSQKFNWK